MSFGDEEARALGVDVRRTRLVVVAAATLMTAAVVSISGVEIDVVDVKRPDGGTRRV